MFSPLQPDTAIAKMAAVVHAKQRIVEVGRRNSLRAQLFNRITTLIGHFPANFRLSIEVASCSLGGTACKR